MATLVSHAKVQIVNRVTRMFKDRGLRVEHEDYSIRSLGDKPQAGVVHMIWGCPYEHDHAVELGKRPDIYWCENGWLTQQSGCYVDKTGTNERSTLVGAITPESPINHKLVWSRIKDIHGWNQIEPQGTAFEGAHFAYHDYIFVPLQAECDTQVRFQKHIPAKYPYKQAWMLQRIVEAFTPRQIIVRPHPRWETIIDYIDKYDPTLLKMPNVKIERAGNSYQWASRAGAVVGMNSTCLVEAMTFDKPVAAFGRGVFTGNGMAMELPDFIDDVDSYLPHVEDFKIGAGVLSRFFTLLFNRQISYHDHSAEDLNKYEVLREMAEYAEGATADAKG